MSDNWNLPPGADADPRAPWHQEDAEPCPTCNSDGDDKPEHPGRVECERNCDAGWKRVPEGVSQSGWPTVCPNPECEDGSVPCPEGCEDGWERGVDPQDEADRRADDECDRRRDEAAERRHGGAE